MWTKLSGGHYHPLTWLSYALDRALWGDGPRGFHFTNVLLHALNASVFFLVAGRLLALAAKTRSVHPLAAAFAALLFALHPLRVEAVAWISERHDLLCAFFYLLALWTYLRAQAEPAARGRWLAASAGCHALALLSKAMAMTLPAALLVLDFFPLRRKDWRRAFAEKMPFLLLSFAAAAVAFLAEVPHGAAAPLEDRGLALRLAASLYSPAFYLWKTIVPERLLPIYPVPFRDSALSWHYLLGGCVTAAISAACFAGRRKRPALLACWLAYLAILSPVLGFLRFSLHIVADHYSYLACLGWPLLAAAALRSWSGLEASRRRAALAGALAVLCGLAGLTRRQIRIWRDPWSFWAYMIRTDPGHWIAYNYMGHLFLLEGRLPEAVRWYEAAVEAEPAYAAAHNNLCNAYSRLGDDASAWRHCREAFRLAPSHERLHYNMAVLMDRQGRYREAAGHYRAELAIDPDMRPAAEGLARALAAEGQKKKKAAEPRPAHTRKAKAS